VHVLPTQLSQELLVAADESSLLAIAGACDLAPSTLSSLVNKRRRADEATLRALCTRTPGPTGLRLLLAHLHDEVERSGRNEHEVTIAARGRKAQDDLSVLADELAAGGDQADALRAVLHDLAELTRSYRRRQAREARPGPGADPELIADADAFTKAALSAKPRPDAPRPKAGSRAPRNKSAAPPTRAVAPPVAATPQKA
jgi:hypothetical protein